MKKNNEIQDELREISPFLAEQKAAGDGFRVPKDYFRSLPDEVLKRVQPSAPLIESPRQNWLDGVTAFFQNLLQPRYALAYASVAVLVVVGVCFWANERGNAQPNTVGLAAISDAELGAYLSENIDAISTDLLETHFAEGSKESLPEVELEELENYLNNELEGIEVDDLEDLL